MRRAVPVALGLMIGLVVTAVAIRVGAENEERRRVLLDILQVEAGQFRAMSREERLAHLRALPDEARRYLVTELTARRGIVTPEQLRQGTTAQVDASPRKPRVTGVIRNDTGNPTGSFATGNVKGNRFNTALTPALTVCPGGPGSCPPVVDPGSITRLSAFIVPSPPPAMSTGWAMAPSFRVFGPQVGASVPLLYSTWMGTTPSGTITLTPGTPINYAGPSFQVGVLDLPGWSSIYTYVTTGGGTATFRYGYSHHVAAYDPGTTGQQGHHAVSIGGLGDTEPINEIPGFNMMIRPRVTSWSRWS